MKQKINSDKLAGISYAVGNQELLVNMPNVPALQNFDTNVIEFLNALSKELLKNKEASIYPDVVTFAFWIRKSNIQLLKEKYEEKDPSVFVEGRGMVFHVAPSNVPVNYAYSLVSGLLSGNANIIKIPSKNFRQVDLINEAIRKCLVEHENIQPYIILVRYGHEANINEALSEFADARVIWGGDRTISEIRKAPLHARAVEVNFADRYSLAVIDSNEYLNRENKQKIASDFYNDTFLTDQNACTSPRIVIWLGEKIEEAKEVFWKELHKLVKSKYQFQPIQAVNKLTSSYLLAASLDSCQKAEVEDNLIVRMQVNSVTDSIMELKDNSGYFFEYDCKNIQELRELCNNTKCQTLSYIGDQRQFLELLRTGIKGIDRIVPVGKTMDFEFIWDGYNILQQLSRTIRMV